jgi:hypothetical protein
LYNSIAERQNVFPQIPLRKEDKSVITIQPADQTQWPVTLDSAELCDPALAENTKSVKLSGDDLLLAAMEFVGIPMPKYKNEYETMTWYWADAQFIVANIQNAHNVNKDATRK